MKGLYIKRDEKVFKVISDPILIKPDTSVPTILVVTVDERGRLHKITLRNGDEVLESLPGGARST